MCQGCRDVISFSPHGHPIEKHGFASLRGKPKLGGHLASKWPRRVSDTRCPAWVPCHAVPCEEPGRQAEAWSWVPALRGPLSRYLGFSILPSRFHLLVISQNVENQCLCPALMGRGAGQ